MRLGVQLLSTGGTAKLLADAGLPVTEVAEVTQFPEMLDGRVKTLHPKVHGGLLARRDLPAHMAALKEHGIDTIDLLVVNLYPFEATVAKAGCTLADAIENIDIGGPAMVRSAAKNWKDVGVVTAADQYAAVLAELKATGKSKRQAALCPVRGRVQPHRPVRRRDQRLPVHVQFEDDKLSRSLRARARRIPGQFNEPLSSRCKTCATAKTATSKPRWYRDLDPLPGSLATGVQLQGKELSYNNIADADAAWECVKSFDVPACVIVKHANPCGVAVGATPLEAYCQGLPDRPHQRLWRHHRLQPHGRQGRCRSRGPSSLLEVLMAPDFTAEALEIFKPKVNVRLMKIALPHGGNLLGAGRNALDDQARRLGPAAANRRQPRAGAG